jgi:hypothetical protein
VILFGSHAQGEANEHSDLDFLVIEPSVHDMIDESVRLRRALSGLDVFADVVVVSEDERLGRRVRDCDPCGSVRGPSAGGVMASSADLAATLLELAAEDELMARSLLPVEGVTDAGIGLHAQQAVEKSLKAVLAFHGVEFPFTHDLDGLVRLSHLPV